MSFFLLVVLIGHVTQILSTCPQGSVNGMDSKTCYIFNSRPLYFFLAEENCEMSGGHLPSIHDAFTNAFLRGLAKSSFNGTINIDDYWLGGTTELAPGNWNWTDGSPFNYNTGIGKPAAAQCLSQQLSNGNWNVQNCNDEDEVKAYACQINLASSGTIHYTTPTAAPKQCPSGWTYFPKTSKCYITVNSTGFDDSNTKCKRLGGNLASIHSVEENNFLAQQFDGVAASNSKNEYFTYIGLYNFNQTIQSNGDYRWTDGTPLNFTNYWVPPYSRGCCLAIKTASSNQDPDQPIGEWYWLYGEEFNGICEISL